MGDRSIGAQPGRPQSSAGPTPRSRTTSQEDGQPRKRDRIVEDIRALIANGEIPRGGRIQQDELAARFGTSITPVREALVLLEAEGVLVGEPHRGLRVAEADPQKLRANYIMRRLVEGYAMKRAALRISRLDLVEARRLIQEMKAAHKRKDASLAGALNRQFHFLFYSRAGVPELEREIDALWLSFPWDILQVLSARIPPSIDEHEELLRAIEAGDLEGVEAATANHLASSHQALMKHLTGVEGPDPFDPTVG